MKYILLIMLLSAIIIVGLIPIQEVTGEQYPPVLYQTRLYGKFDVNACYQEIKSVSQSKGWKCQAIGNNLELTKIGVFGQWKLDVMEGDGYVSPRELDTKISWLGRQIGVQESCSFVWKIIDKHTRIQRK
jgi:hypothetical protein